MRKTKDKIRNAKSEMRNVSGFTLIELIIVIAIIAILAAAIFVAIDPARRLHESRNATRSNDVATILEAIKTYQADHEGTHYSTVAATATGLYYQIGTAVSGCGRVCGSVYTEGECVNLTSIGDNYLAVIPKDQNDGTAEETGYALKKGVSGSITVIACDPEGEGAGGAGVPPTIQAVR